MTVMAGKSAPFSLRLSEETDRFVTAEAKRTKRSKGSVVETLAEEALKARLVPGIAFRGDDYNRRAWLIGTSLDGGNRPHPARAKDRAQLLRTLPAGDRRFHRTGPATARGVARGAPAR